MRVPVWHLCSLSFAYYVSFFRTYCAVSSPKLFSYALAFMLASYFRLHRRSVRQFVYHSSVERRTRESYSRQTVGDGTRTSQRVYLFFESHINSEGNEASRLAEVSHAKPCAPDYDRLATLRPENANLSF